MIDVENEYKRAFKFNKRHAKHWTTYSAHRAHSSTTYLLAPAKKIFKFINELEANTLLYEEKFGLLMDFYCTEEEKERSKDIMVSSFYHDCLRYCQRAISDIKDGVPVTIRKMSKG